MQDTEDHGDSALDLSVLAHNEYGSTNKPVDGKAVGMGPESYNV